MSQESDLQDALALLGVLGTGVAEIITRLGNIPTDNPAINDEISGIRAAAQAMVDQVNTALNPPPA